MGRNAGPVQGVRSLQPASPQVPVPERDPLELPSCTTLTGSSNVRILGETIEQMEASAGLGPCPLLVKSEPVDEEPPSSPPPRPLCLQDLLCREELTDDLQPSDNAHLQSALPQAPVPERDPLELPSCTTQTDSSSLSILGETIEQMEASACLGPCPLLVKSEPVDEEPPSSPPPRPLCLQDLLCREKLTDDLQPSDNAHLQPASPLAPVPERDPLELPSCTTVTGSINVRIPGQGWAEYAEPCKGELDIEDWKPPAEEDLAQEAATNDPVLLAPHILTKLGPEKSDSLAGSRAAPTALVQQQFHGSTICDQNLVSKDRVCKKVLPKTQLSTCEKCGAQFANKCNFHEHTRTHTRVGWHKCKVCGKYFSRASSLLTHAQTHTGDQNLVSKDHVCKQVLPKTQLFTCEKCGAQFANKCNYHKHMRTHTGEGCHKCKVCGKYFSRVSSLLTHTRTHINTGEKERKYFCEVCGKAFTHPGTLIKHKCTLTNKRPFKCNVCRKAFNNSCNLIVHTRIHTGERPFTCEVCEKAFKASGALKVHTRTHTGERPFNCEVCEKAFKTSGALKVHTRTHTGERPFKCKVCEKAFKNSGHLIVHTLIHTGERPFKCEVCKKAFKTYQDRIKHTSTHTGREDSIARCAGRHSKDLNT